MGQSSQGADVLVARRDPRLAQLAFGWCVQHGRLISVSRLRGLRDQAPENVRRAFSPWATRLQDHGLKWPGSGEGVEPIAISDPADRTMNLDWSSPALVRLRARRLFGPGSRADVICELLARPDQPLSSPDLLWTGYSKRALSLSLSDLTDAGVTILSTRKQAYTYRLREPAPLLQVLQARQVRWIDLHLLLRLLVVADELHLHRDEPGIAQRIAALRLRDEVARWVPFDWLEVPALDGDPNAPERLGGWIHEKVADLGLR